MHILKKNWFAFFIITLILATLMVLTITSESQKKLDRKVIALFMSNGIIWLFLLLREIKKTAYSLKIMNWFFCLFFFSLAPTVQYYSGIFPWIIVRSDNVLLRANKLLLLWTLSVILGIRLGKHKTHKQKIKKWNQWKGYERLLFGLTLFNLANSIFRIATIGIGNLISRGTNIGIKYSNYESMSMMISGIIQGICYFTVVLSILQYKYNKKCLKNYVYLCINMILFTMVYFPTGLARYAAAVIYLGFIITYCNNFKKNRYFIILFLLAFTIVMPFMNAFRNTKFSEVNIIQVITDVSNNITSNWKAWDYDAYTYFTLTIEYVDKYGAGGHHLLSDLLFWVPRRIWPTKALSGSYEIAHDLGLFDNVSFPYPSIGYMDGGGAGMVLFGLFIGYIMESVDGYYWNQIDINGKIVHSFDILYPVIMIFWFFLYRGDIFYTLAYLVGYILAWRFIVQLATMKKITMSG